MNCQIIFYQKTKFGSKCAIIDYFLLEKFKTVARKRKEAMKECFIQQK